MRRTNEEGRTRHAFNKLTRLLISVRDFQEALSAATFLLEEVDQSAKYSLAEIRRFRCYETAMVIAYARPFSMAKGDVEPLKPKDTGLSMTAAEKSLHRKLITHRNTVYGHSDAEFVEMRVMVLRPISNGRPLHVTTGADGVLEIRHGPGNGDGNASANPAGSDWVMPRFEEGMRFSLTEIGALHDMLLKLVRALAHQCQKLGAAFKDRFTTYEV